MGAPVASASSLGHRRRLVSPLLVVPLAELSETRRGIAALLLSSMLLATMSVLVQIAARTMPPAQILFVRMLGSFVLLRVVAGRRRLRPKPGNLRRVLLRGILGSGGIFCYFFAIGEIGAGLATLLYCTYPIPTAIFAVLFLGETASWRLGAAVVLELAGLWFVVGHGVDLGQASATGMGIALAGSIIAGAALATVRHLRGSEDAWLITIYFMAVGAVISTPALASGWPPWSPGLVGVLLGVIVTSAGGQWLLHHGLGFVPASVGSLTCATGVFTAAALEALVFGSHFGRSASIGALFMVLAVGLAARPARAPAALRDAA